MAEYTKKQYKDLVVRARDCYKKAVDADGGNRRLAMEDIKFVVIKGEQYSSITKKERGEDRLMLEFNKTKVQCKRVINEMRANRPQGKIRGTEDNDKAIAEIREGLARNIWSVSDGESISDYQAQYQVYAGYGAWEICTDYADDSAFDQDILVKSLPNPFCLWFDPSAKDMLKRDAKWWLKTEKLTKEAFESAYPKADRVSFEDTEFDDDEEWEDDESVRVCEYWWKEPVTKTIALLQDGKTVDIAKDQPDPALIVKQRKVKSHKIMTAIVSGDSVLSEPAEWAGKFFPFIVVYGDYILIDGKIHWQGMVRDLKDAQMAYNDSRTSIVETIALAPQSKVWATAEQAKGHVNAWAEAHKKNLPMMLYNTDPNAPGPPIRIGGADVPVALIQAAQMASEEINSLAGFVFDPSSQDNKNSSGKALNARARQGQIVTFNYPDNMGKAMKFTWEILNDLIPKIYDTERSVRILGADGAEKFMKVNQVDPVTGQVMNDLSQGKYDITVTVGPSYATQRQESVEAYTDIATRNPELMGVAGDLIFKNMDLPGSEQIAERMKFMLAPPIQKSLAEEGKQSPEVQQAMMQVEQMQQQVQQQGQLVEQAANEAQAEVSKADKAKADVQVALAQLKVEEANFKVMQAQFEASVATKKAELQGMATDVDVREFKVDQEQQQAEQVKQHAESAIAQINELVKGVQAETQEFLSTAAQVTTDRLQQIETKPKPKATVGRIRREGGKMVADVDYDDGTRKTAVGERKNGETSVSFQ